MQRSGKAKGKRIQHTRPDVRELLKKLEHDHESLVLVVRLIERLAARSSPLNKIRRR
jgi:hypothetical protein